MWGCKDSPDNKLVEVRKVQEHLQLISDTVLEFQVSVSVFILFFSLIILEGGEPAT